MTSLFSFATLAKARVAWPCIRKKKKLSQLHNAMSKFSDKFQIYVSLNSLNQMMTCVIQDNITLGNCSLKFATCYLAHKIKIIFLFIIKELLPLLK